MEIILDIIEGDFMINELMHCADIFESGKKLGQFNQIIVSGEPNLSKLVTNIKLAYEQTNRIVIFANIRSIDEKINTKFKPFIMPGIQSILDGKKFSLFRDILTFAGYSVKTNKHMQVLTAKLI